MSPSVDEIKGESDNTGPLGEVPSEDAILPSDLLFLRALELGLGTGRKGRREVELEEEGRGRKWEQAINVNSAMIGISSKEPKAPIKRLALPTDLGDT